MSFQRLMIHIRQSKYNKDRYVPLSPLIISYSNDHVSFSFTNYRHANQKKIITFSRWEFIRRFAMHILPKGFMRIRHFGILNGKCQDIIFPDLKCENNFDWIDFWKENGFDVLKCLYCLSGSPDSYRAQLLGKLEPLRGPPTLVNLKTIHYAS